MRYLALCRDHDGTLAHEGIIDEKTVAALERLLASGRELDELKSFTGPASFPFPHRQVEKRNTIALCRVEHSA